MNVCVCAWRVGLLDVNFKCALWRRGETLEKRKFQGHTHRMAYALYIRCIIIFRILLLLRGARSMRTTTMR